jgi:hypothetical protein
MGAGLPKLVKVRTLTLWKCWVGWCAPRSTPLMVERTWRMRPWWSSQTVNELVEVER